ncbi:hypothetical protein RclHR1_02240003 [Rhizophagus clarus]|uniref:BTB/POZ domain-containing protein n=1 Tax=Rhizophagus clarus TaxID=94130 RepID=A0A2Z6RA61_9GLOM|nr:hypothetical protein RclHR1_02240003 [Rhizophagus clarus]GES90402.1 BTB/POZ domain-containing protein [Rhizophagus clarus]
MEYDYTSDLLQDFANLFENSDDYDVKITVGKTPNSKEFEAHSTILSARSTYFQRTFLKYWVNSEKPIIFEKPDVSPSIFKILLRYIYTGLISFDNKVNKVSLVDVIIAADELELNAVVHQLENKLLQNESDWQFPKDFIKICQQKKKFLKLYKFALEFICKNPKIIFESEDFLKMDETILIQLLECDYLELKEIEIWKYLIKWGIKNTDSILDDDLTKWKQMNYMQLEKTLQNCIPYIRFLQMSPNDYIKVRNDFKSILPDGLDDKVIKYFLNSNPEPSNNVLSSRILEHPLESKIINAKDAAFIASWVNKKQGEPYHFNNLPYEFKLIYRAGREGSNVNNFHDCCDNKGPTVVVIKVQDTNEIIGGYNQLDWRSAKSTGNEPSFLLYHNRDFYNEYQCETPSSFIFSLTNRAIPILSRVSSKKEAIIWCKNKGPCFGLQDLWIQNDSPLNNIVGESKQRSYEKKIIDRENFVIEEYEVFQIIDSRRDSKSYFRHKLFLFFLSFRFIYYYFRSGHS